MAPWLSALVVVVLSLGSTVAEEVDLDSFARLAPTACRCYIFDNYDAFRESELTFKHLKKHLRNELKVSMEFLKSDDASQIIEAATDEVANQCNMGEIPMSTCKRRVDHQDEDCIGAQRNKAEL